MAGRIPEQFIDTLLARVDIVEVIGSRIQLKKTGANHSACCPFHNEKTPSFTVSQTKQFYHCFGCGVNGSAIRFLMEYDNLEFVEAIEELARFAGLDVPRESYGARKKEPPKDLYQIMETASKHFQNWLKKPSASEAVNYLKNRGLTGEVASDFGIGYVPDGWRNILDKFQDSQQSDLINCGLVIENENGKRYDRFRDRIMFPIRDRRGRVIAFGGRVISDGTPKYLNSPETPIFHKGSELYGLYETLQHNKKVNNILVVEGYMDVVALAQFNIRNAVATLGTATSSDHIERLFKVTPEIIFCFDGDNAGRKAAWKALEISLPKIKAGKQARFLFLPDGEDPDTLIRNHGQEYFLQQIDKAVPLSEFLLNNLSENMDLSSIDTCSRFIEKAKPYVKSIPPGTFRELLVEQLSKLTRHKLGRVEKLSKLIFADQNDQNGTVKGSTAEQQRSPMRSAIAFLIHKPDLHTKVTCPEEYAELDISGMNLFIDLINFIKDNPNTNTGAIIERWRNSEFSSSINKLAAWNHLLLDNEKIETEFDGIINIFNTQLYNKKLFYYEQKLRQDGLTTEEKIEFNKLLIGSNNSKR